MGAIESTVKTSAGKLIQAVLITSSLFCWSFATLESGAENCGGPGTSQKKGTKYVLTHCWRISHPSSLSLSMTVEFFFTWLGGSGVWVVV